MRIAILLFFGTTFGFTPIKSLSQEIVHFKANEVLTVDAVFEQIEAQTSYRFIYPSDIFKEFPEVKVKKGSIKVEKLLEDCFSGNPINFKIGAKNSILLSKIPKNLPDLSLQQDIEIRGMVTDENGVPLPGVNITVEGTSRGTQTDFDGNYTINAEKGQVLHFSFVGFEDYTITIGEDAVIDVPMKESASALEEVIVTAFGRKMTRTESTSSVTSIGTEDLEKVVHVDVREALQGKVPGMVMVTTSGTPGAEPEIRIRGINSITASNDPLYVIDGVPVSNDAMSTGDNISTLGIFSLVNSDDIENISILKDASAVAPYGADGSNGVILITTKEGKAGKTRFSLNTSIGIQNEASRGPRVMNAEQKLDALTESVWNTFGSGQFGNGQIQSRDEVIDFINNNITSQVETWEKLGRPNFNWRDKVRNTNAFLSNINFSVSKGNEDSKFYASLGYNKTDGTTLGTDLKRITGSINYSTKFGKRFDFKVSAIVGNTDQNGVNETDTRLANLGNPTYVKFSLSPWVTPYNEDGSYRLDDFLANSGGLYNPFYYVDKNIYNKNIIRAIQNTQLNIEILKGLSFNSVLGIDYTSNYSKVFTNIDHGSTVHGTGTENSQRSFSYTIQNSLDYNFEFDKHHFDILALREYSKFKNHLLMSSGQNFPSNELNNLSASGSNWKVNSTFSDLIKERYVGLVSYNYDLKYLLDLSYSYQGDSRFSRKFSDFYSIGAAWNMHKEPFMQALNFINRLSLKVGYGLTGNAGINRNQFQELASFGNYRGELAFNIENFGTDATWELSHRFDIGLEFSLLSNRLQGSVGFYNNITSDMLLEVPVPFAGGYVGGEVLQNIGKMRNRGVEIAIGGDIIKTPDFLWRMDASLSTFSNMVTDFPEGTAITDEYYSTREGHMINEWYMPDWAGIDPQNGLPLWYKDKSESEETTSNYSEAKRVFQGSNPLPKYSGSVSTHFEFKNIFLDATAYYSGGNKVFEFKGKFMNNTSGNNIQSNNITEASYLGAWREVGDQATYPRFDYNDPVVSGAATNNSTRFLYDDDFIRLQDVALGYNFNKDFIEKIGLDQLSLSVRGRNLLTWKKDPDLKWDPEVSTNGITNMMTPPIKSIILNLNIKF